MGRAHVELAGQPVVAELSVEASQPVGDLGVARGLASGLLQQREEPLFGLLVAPLPDEGQHLPVAELERGGVEHPPCRIFILQNEPVVAGLVADGRVVAVEETVTLVVGGPQRIGERGAGGGVEDGLRFEALARIGVELGEVQAGGDAGAAVVQFAGDREVALRIADGRVELVFPELPAEPFVDGVLLAGGEARYAEHAAEFVDARLLPLFIDPAVADGRVELLLQRARFVRAAGRQARCGEQQHEVPSGSVCAIEDLHLVVRSRAEGPGDVKVRTFSEIRRPQQPPERIFCRGDAKKRDPIPGPVHGEGEDGVLYRPVPP